MRKFKVIRSWPGSPEVGSIGELGIACVSFNGSWYHLPELEGFVEEIKEPEEFWFVNNDGHIHTGYVGGYADNTVPWFRFVTKDSAEKFANALKELHGQDIACAVIADDAKQGDLLINVLNALNDRVK